MPRERGGRERESAGASIEELPRGLQRRADRGDDPHGSQGHRDEGVGQGLRRALQRRGDRGARRLHPKLGRERAGGRGRPAAGRRGVGTVARARRPSCSRAGSMPMTLEEAAASGGDRRPPLSALRVAMRWLELWAWVVVLLLATIPITMLLGGAITRKIDEPRLIPVVLWGLIAACLATRLVARRGRFTWPELGLSREGAARDTLLGFAIGLANFALVIVMAAPFGWVTVSLAPLRPALGLTLAATTLFLLLAGAFEEITNRGLP